MGFWSIVPPALAIGLSMLTRQVHLSLFAGQDVAVTTDFRQIIAEALPPMIAAALG